MTRIAYGAALAALVLTAPARGAGGFWFSASFSTYSYPLRPVRPVVYYSAPVYYYAAPRPVVCVPAPVVTPTPIAYPAPVPYAQPVPAPPSAAPKQTGEPPLAPAGPSAPKVNESSFNATKAMEEAKDRCRVGFWNVTGRDVVLIIDGQRRAVARDRNLTLTLGRQFTWQVDGRAPQTASVPAGEDTLEIVLRQ